MSDHDILPTVTILLRWRSPSAVLLTVWSVIVSAVDRVAWRAFAHVGDESWQSVRPKPFLADGYPATAIVIPLPMLRVTAAIVEGFPCLVQGVLCKAVTAQAVSFSAATGSCVATLQVPSSRFGLLPARTLAHKMRRAFCSARSNTDDSKSVKFHTSEIVERRHFLPLVAMRVM